MKKSNKTTLNPYAAFDAKTVRLCNIRLAVHDIMKYKNKIDINLINKIIKINDKTSKLATESCKRSQKENKSNPKPQRMLINKEYGYNAINSALCNLEISLDEVIRHKDIKDKALIKLINQVKTMIYKLLS